MAGQPSFRRLIAASTAVASLFAIYAESTQAQRRRSRTSSLFQTLMDRRVEKEINLTDTQKKQISDLSKKSQFGRDQYSPYLARIEAAKTDAEKDKIREEMRVAAEKHRDTVDEQANMLLNEAQRTRVQQLRYRFARSGGLLMTSAIAELKITDDQKKKIEAARKELTNAYYKISRRERYKPEVLAKFYAEWNPKLYAALTPDQRTKWTKMLGDPPSWEKASAKTSGSTGSSTKSGSTNSSSVRRPAKSVPKGSYVASFDAKKAGSTSTNVEPKTSYGSGTSKAAPKKRNPKEKQNISFTFKNAPWKIVIEQFAKKAGLRLDAPEVPAGTFGYEDNSVYTPTRALDLINGYLLAKKFILIRRGKFLVVHNLEKPVPQNIVPDVKVEDLPYRGNNELLRVTFNLNPLADIKQAKLEVEELLNTAESPQNKAIAVTTASMLIVTAIGSELTKIAKILEKVTVPPDEAKLSVKAFKLVHISATDAAKILKDMLNAQQTVRNVSRGGQSSSGGDRRAQFMQMMMARRGGGRSSRGGSRGGFGGSSTSSRTTGDASVKVTADDRTNNVLVIAPMAKVNMAEELIKSIDVPLNAEQQRNFTRSSGPYLKVYKVSQVNSTEVTKTLTALLPEQSVINEDGYNHTIHIWGDDELQAVAKELIEKMDGQGEGGLTLDTVPVRNLEVTAVANSLSQMFVNERNNPPQIQADVRGRQLLVKASKSQIETIRSFVAKLEANAQPVNSVADIRNNFMKIQVNGDPNQVAAALQKVWNNSNKKSFLNVIRSENQSPIRARMDSSGRRISPGFRPDADRNGRGFTPPSRDTNTKQPPPKRTTTDRRTRRPMSIGEYYAMHTPAFGKYGTRNETFPTAAPAKSEKSKTSTTQANADGKPQITITVQNGQLIVYSKDKQALLQINQMANQLQELMPNKQTWTVIYLQAADATETATMLGNLFPTSSVTETSNSTSMFGSMTSGIRSFGNTLMDMSGTSLGNVDELKIIPEIRSNALFISGPYAKVQDVREVLSVLDATDIPSGARDRLPRMIPVRYANVNDVAQNIRDLFAPEMQAQRGGSSRGNPLAMLMGGGGRGGRGGRSSGGSRQQPQVKLTLGVDERTGHILVSCDDAVFQRVEQMVYDLDKTAYEAKQTTRVVQLQHASAATISQTLTAMYPNVSVTVSSSSSNSRNNNNRNQQNSSNNNDNNNNSRSDAERNARRAMFMQMMQQRGGQNGGRSSSPFSGRSSRGFDSGRGGRGSFNFGGRGSGGRGFGGRGGRGGRRN